jgi:hypothetical protein
MRIINTYSPGVKIGNWFEDAAREKATLESFVSQRENGTLILNSAPAVKGFAGIPNVQLTAGESGIRFGECFQLRSVDDAILASFDTKIEALSSSSPPPLAGAAGRVVPHNTVFQILP